MNKITIGDDIKIIVKRVWEKVEEIDVEVRDIKGRLEQVEGQGDTHDNDIRRLADAIIQLQAKVNTIEHRLNEEIKEREMSEENIRDDMEDIEGQVEDIEEQIEDMEDDIEYIKENMEEVM